MPLSLREHIGSMSLVYLPSTRRSCLCAHLRGSKMDYDEALRELQNEQVQVYVERAKEERKKKDKDRDEYFAELIDELTGVEDGE